MANGHPDAGVYPVHRVWEEAEIVVQRWNHQTATESILLLMAVSAGMGSKEALKEFNEIIKDFTDNE